MEEREAVKDRTDGRCRNYRQYHAHGCCKFPSGLLSFTDALTNYCCRCSPETSKPPLTRRMTTKDGSNDRRIVGWTSVMFALQLWLNETPTSIAAGKQPAYFTVGMSCKSPPMPSPTSYWFLTRWIVMSLLMVLTPHQLDDTERWILIEGTVLHEHLLPTTSQEPRPCRIRNEPCCAGPGIDLGWELERMRRGGFEVWAFGTVLGVYIIVVMLILSFGWFWMVKLVSGVLSAVGEASSTVLI